ncbi:MAG: dockerin type I domain-containing protein [Oscillospiraceae bacterium]|nr:dockerin type I domain-containing protein [Oscillospiraceae bacterium]
MKKRIFCTIAALLLLLLPASPVTANPPPITTVVTTSQRVVRAGEEFTVKVSMANYGSNAIDALEGLQIHLPASAEYLEFISQRTADQNRLHFDGKGRTLDSSFDKGEYIYVAYMNNPGDKIPKTNTDIFEIRFRLRKEIPVGERIVLNVRHTVYTFKAGNKLQAEYVPAAIIGLPRKGDVSLDGFVDASDSLLIRDDILGRANLCEYARAAADINNDGHINIFDLIKVRDIILR